MSDPETPTAAVADLLTRRAALRRAAAVLGYALATPTVVGVLSGLAAEPAGAAVPGAAPAGDAAAAYQLRALTPEQDRLVTAIAEHILPATDTPGARDARVNEFIDRMLADYYPAEARARFAAGLARVDVRARRRHGRPFLECTGAEQYALVDALDAQAFDGAPATAERAATAGAATRRNPVTQPQTDVAGHSYTSAAGSASGAVTTDGKPDPEDVGRQAFFRTLKELTVVGYYTSEPGATRELRPMPIGRYRGDVPYAAPRPAWA